MLKQTAYVSLLILAVSPAIVTQERAEQIPTWQRSYPMATEPANCESDIAVLEAAHHDAGKESLIIAVARLGDGERNRGLNGRRLHNVRA